MMMLVSKSNNIYLILATLLCIVNAAKEDKSEQEKVLTPQEVSTKKPDVLDQQVEEKPFKSNEISVITFRNGTFANVSDCLYFYQRGGSIKLRSLANKNRTEHIHLTFDHTPIRKKAECIKNSTTHQVSIGLTFQLLNGTTNTGTVRVDMSIVKNKRANWEVEKMRAKLKGVNEDLNKGFNVTCKHLETPIEFSYSCKAFSIQSTNGSDILTLEFNNLQIQPFYTGKVFAESFDCSTLFTLGSWMGMIVVWVFTLVVAIGAYSLLSIKTMDRFDNAKGKSIINVAATDQ